MTLDTRPRSLVCLTGFMGCGKSTVARLLGRQMGWLYVDLDKRIVEAAKQTIPEIFAKRGEPEFRKIEYEELTRIVGEAAEQQKSRVVSLGGGRPRNQKTWRFCAKRVRFWYGSDAQ